ncbi:MAG: TetR/AcrR family transcriptional regulator [Muribaculaceae bacterium]|nr:TetR/AcrR family transcriptional regulator [Muribaculaceae bacterium]
MVLKTREKLIDVARQLFARKGIENTTMSDIANASDKGRRTIYTYFRTKRDIYDAVIEHESEQIVSRLREVEAETMLPPSEKLRKFLTLRVALIEKAAQQQDSIRVFFTRDLKRLDRIRNLVSQKEQEIMGSILAVGIASGEFDKTQAERLPSLLRVIAQGLDIGYLRDNFEDISVDSSTMHETIIEFIINAIKSPSYQQKS